MLTATSLLMAPTTVTDLLHATFRANPEYELVLFDRLPDAQKELFHDLCRDEDFYGVLRPRPGSGLGVKSVCRNAALLFLTLKEPGPLPAYVRRTDGPARDKVLTQFVWDGVLQVECGGRFCSGAQAGLLLPVADTDELGRGVLARLSLAALRYAQALAVDDIARLSARMYFCNRLPVTPRLSRQFPSPRHVADHLRFGPGGRAGALLEAHWSRAADAPGREAWCLWDHGAAGPTRWDSAGTYKLYVSPGFGALGDVFPEVVEVFTAMKVPRFKAGRTLAGLLRPDKVVAYFPSFDPLAQVAAALARRLAGIPPHGTPFTAELAGDGLLSWGVDPPGSQKALGWQERESWRLWVTNRLAAALLAARAAGVGPLEPWQAALQRLRLEGVDTATWAPVERPWE